MDSKMKRGRSVLRDLFIIICLFIPCIVIWLSYAVISLVRKVYAYVQSEWERFNDIYFDNTAVWKDVDPAYLAYRKGEDSVTGPCCCNHTSASRELSKRSKFRHHFLAFVNSLARMPLFVPEKIYAYVQRVSEDYHNIYGDSMVELPYTEPALIAYLKGEEGAPFLKNPHVTFSDSDSRDLKNFAANSDIESRNQRQGQNGKVTEGLSLVRLVYKLFCCIRIAISALYLRCHPLTFRGQVNGEKHFETSQEMRHPYFNERKVQNVDKAANVYHSRQAVKLQETVAAHPGTVPFPPAFPVGSDQGHLFKCSGALRTAWNDPVNLIRVPPNTGPKLWSSSLHSGAGKKQWNASPAVAKRTETQVKLFSEGKANGEVMQPSTLRSKADSAGSASVCNSKTEKKVKERVTPFLFSVANVDTPAPAAPVKEKGKGKVMPGLILTSHVPVLPRVKQQDQGKATGVVRSNQVRSANVCADSEPVPTRKHDTSSIEEPIEVKHTGSAVKQAKNKKERIEAKGRENRLSADAPLRQAKKVTFCLDSEAVATHNHVSSSFEEQTNMESKVSGVKRAKNKDGCLKDTSKKSTSLEDLHSGQSTCSSNVSTESEANSTHGHVTSSAEEQIEMKPEVSRVKRTKNKELRRKKFRENASSPDALSCHFKSANVCVDSQVSEFQTNGKTSDHKEQIVEEPLVARTKRTRNEDECEQPRSWDARACINSTEHPSNTTLGRSTRHAKRKAECSSDAISESKQTEFVSGQIHEVDLQKIAEQRELMEVVDSPPERAFPALPEPMETGGEENAKIFLFGEPSEAKAPFSASFMEELESMETDQQESGIFFGDAETEEMETNQASLFDEFSFAWANVMQSFLVQPAEEMMETDQESGAATPCVAQLKEVMETMQAPFQMPMPFRQVGNSNFPVATGMGTSEANFRIPVEEEAMETQELGDAYTPVETKLGELADAKRPLASTAGMSKEETLLTNTPGAEEPVVQTVKEPVVQTVREPVVQTVREPVVQTVKEPAMPPLKERTMPPPLVKTELLQSTQPSALIYSEHLQRMESKLNNEPGFVTIEQQQLVAVETEETKSASQLTMEQLQLVPEDPYFPDGLDSDSDSDDSSDDEYELDLATINEFSELHAEPEHVQLIMKLLTEKELTSEQ